MTLGDSKSNTVRIIDVIAHHRYMAYSVLFLVMLVCMQLRHIYWGTGLIWCVDGVEQQYPVFIAEGRWLRELGQNLLSGQLSVPQWTMNTGYGADYIGVLLPSLGNPFNLLSVFATPATAELFLTIAVVLQLFLAGVVFIWYCDYWRFDAFSSVIGASVYVFSGYTALVYSQLFMLYPLVLAPLTLLGVDRIFDKRSPVLFIVSQALCALYSITMIYAADLLLVVYCIARYLLLDEPKCAAGFTKWFLKILGNVFLGLLISCVLIVPTVLMLMGQGRLGLERPFDLLYDASYYSNTFSGLIYPVSVGADCFYGYAPIAIFGILALFITREKGEKIPIALSTMLITMVVILALPLLGRLYNGFAYPNNRWVWALSLAIGLTVVYTLPKIETMNKAKRRTFIVLCLVFGIAEAILLATGFSWYFGAALFTFALLLLAYIMLTGEHDVQLWRLAVLVSLPLWCISVFWFWSVLLPSEDMDWGETYEITESESPVQMLKDIDWDNGSCYHYDGVGYDSRRNACLALGIPGSSFYSSYYNSLVDMYHDELGLTSSDLNFSFIGFQGRTALEALAGVKYYLVADGVDERVPSLYADTIARGSNNGINYSLREASASLPVAFQYRQQISASSFDSLSMVEKQEALLQGMVVEQNGIDAKTLDFSMLERPSWSSSLLPEGGEIEVVNADEPIIVDVQIPAGKVAYLELKDFESDDWALKDTERYTASPSVYITCESGEIVNGILQYYPTSHLYAGKSDWTVNLGETDYDRNEIKIWFSSIGTYRYSSFDIVLEDDVSAAEKVKALSAGACEDVLYNGNDIEGSVDMDINGGSVFFRVPYSQGWAATVDGHPVSVDRANIAFMSIRVESGLHVVRLHYSTPGLGIGSLLTVIGIIGTVLVGLMQRRRQDEQV